MCVAKPNRFGMTMFSSHYQNRRSALLHFGDFVNGHVSLACTDRPSMQCS